MNHQRHQLAFISKFATDIAHMPGLDNIMPDAFTRQYDHEESAVVHSVAHSLVDVDLAELVKEQRSIDEEPVTSLCLEKISFPEVEEQVVCDMSHGHSRVLVPGSRHRQIYEAVHGLAHPSGKVTLAMVARSYVWPGMRKDIIQWAQQCQACAVSKVARHTNPPVRPIQVPQERFAHVHVDIVGPFPQDRGFCYVLTMLDRTTRWPEAIPLADTAADSIVQAFLESWVSRYGIPFTVSSDRGAQFTSEAWRANLNRLGIRVTTTTSYHPQANGMVERFHRSVKNALRCAARASSSWTRTLPWVMLGLQNAPRDDTATSTAEVVYGVPQRIPGMCFQKEQSRPRSAEEQLQLAWANADTHSPRVLDLTKFKSSPFIAKALRTAKYVYVRDDRLSKPSLAPRYTGPFRVIEKDWMNSTFWLNLGKKEDNVSLARLKAASVPADAT